MWFGPTEQMDAAVTVSISVANGTASALSGSGRAIGWNATSTVNQSLRDR